MKNKSPTSSVPRSAPPVQMRKPYIVLLAIIAFLLLLGCTTPSSKTGTLISGVESNPLYTGLGLGSWRSLSILIAFISVLLIGVAFMVAEPFNIPQLKAWANEELAQAVVTALILISVIFVLDMADGMLFEQVNGAPGSPFQCLSIVNQTCTVQVANQYLDGLINMSVSGAKESFTRGIDVMKQQAKGQTMSCGTLLWPPCFMFYDTTRNNAYMMLDYERYAQEVELYGSILYSLQVQRFFSNYITNIVGPFLLVLGILARNFFVTRKLGGLLMASGLALLIVFPAMYLWNAISLNMALYGDDLLNAKGDCPAACKMSAPITYNSNGPIYYVSGLPFGNDTGRLADVQGLLNGSLASVSGYPSCEYLGLHTGMTMLDNQSNVVNVTCPAECRELPYPYYVDACQDNNTELACNKLPKGCKTIRNSTYDGCNNNDKFVSGSGNLNLSEDYCPEYCKIIPPLTGAGWSGTSESCNVCVDAPWNCRLAVRNDTANRPNGTLWRPDSCIMNLGSGANGITQDSLDANARIRNATIHCIATMNENTTCDWVLPDPPDAACEGPSCCVGNGNCRETNHLSITTPTLTSPMNSSSIVIFACIKSNGDLSYVNLPNCTLGTCFAANPAAPNSGCEAAGPDITNITCGNIKGAYDNTNDNDVKTIIQTQFGYCLTSPPTTPLYYNLSASCWAPPTVCVDANNDGECDLHSACVAYGPDKVSPSARCNGCFNVNTSACLHTPPIVTNCNEECDETGTNSPLVVSPAEFAKKSQDWMFGRQDIKNVSSLLVPAYLLPLLNIAVTLIFIRTFSPLLGGDIEIPGWAKVL